MMFRLTDIFILSLLFSFSLFSCGKELDTRISSDKIQSSVILLCDASIYGKDCNNPDNFVLVKKEELKPENIVKESSIGGVVGTAEVGDGRKECSEDNEVGCVTTDKYRSINIEPHLDFILEDHNILGKSGRVENCSAGDNSCYIDLDFKAAESSKLIPSNIKSSVSIAGVNGIYSGEHSSCSSLVHTDCIATDDYPSVSIDLKSYLLSSQSINGEYGLVGDCGVGENNCYINGVGFKAAESSKLIPSNINASVSIAGVQGDFEGDYSTCSEDGSTGCIATDTYKATNINDHRSKIISTESINGITGTFVPPSTSVVLASATYGVGGAISGTMPYCLEGGSGCYLKSYSEGVDGYQLQAFNFDDMYLNRSNIKNGYQIVYGITGTQSVCSDGDNSCYIDGSSLTAVNSSNLVAANIKKDVSLGGVTGNYPSLLYPLADATASTDLTTTNFNDLLVSNDSFEWFDSIGTRYTRSGDTDLVEGNIKKDVDIFGTVGTYEVASKVSYKGVSNSNALALKKENGTVLCFGNNSYGGDCSEVEGLDHVKNVYATRNAFAALKEDGTVVSWGVDAEGGNPSYSDENTAAANGTLDHIVDITPMYHNLYNGAFAAIKEENDVRSVVTWGNKNSGGDFSYSEEYVVAAPVGSLSSGVKSVFATSRMNAYWGAFAALKEDGSVVTWGYSVTGGDSSTPIGGSLSSDVVDIFSTNGAFAALKEDGSVVTWGSSSDGGDFSYSDEYVVTAPVGSLSSGVINIFSTMQAFAALKEDGSVVTWGNADGGGDSSTPVGGILSSGVVNIFSAQHGAFAALKLNGSVVTWGNSAYGGDSSTPIGGSLSSGVVKIFSTSSAFAALKKDGSVVTWGSSYDGGDSSTPIGGSLSSGVVNIFSTNGAFAALKEDGTVVTWGNSSYGGDTSSIITYTGSSSVSDIVDIFASDNFFVGVRENGSYVVWGSYY